MKAFVFIGFDNECLCLFVESKPAKRRDQALGKASGRCMPVDGWIKLPVLVAKCSDLGGEMALSWM